MKKFLSMFFMLSVLPTIGLAVDTTSTTYQAYKPLENYKNQANEYKDKESETHKTFHHKPQYAKMCKDLLSFTKKYGLDYANTVYNYHSPLQDDKGCDKRFLGLPDANAAATKFLSDLDYVNEQIVNKQINIVKERCNINHGKSPYKRMVWAPDAFTINEKKARVECAATSGDNRCLLIQPIEPYRDSVQPAYYYSCNRPELEFGELSNGSGYISIKADKYTCGVMAESDTTAGILDDRIPLTLNDFDENCQLIDKDIKKLAENKYASQAEEDYLIGLVTSRAEIK